MIHELGNITNFYTSSGTIKIKITKNSSPIAITHAQGFTNYFPEVDLLPTSLYNLVVLFKFYLFVDLIVGFVRVIKLIVLLLKFV